MTRKKVSIIGAGCTGATAAFVAAQKELGNIVLVDIHQSEDLIKGKELDIDEKEQIHRYNSKVIGTSNYEDTKDSDVVIITAGIARKPGMSRDDLVQTNQKVMKSVTEQIVKYSPNAIILVLTNPV